jgi:hypothetical protein
VGRFVSELDKALLIIELRDEVQSSDSESVESSKLVLYQPITSEKVEAIYDGLKV